jgi:16S rRNA (uracil1498-N3)-methyltransferase
MSLPRFFVPQLDVGLLPEAEAHHALDVLRLNPGDPIVCFDGRGTEAKAQLAAGGKKHAAFRILTRETAPAPRRRLHLAQAIPKGKSWDLILQKITELGVDVLHPLLSERTVVRYSPEEAKDKLAKWSDTLVEACKQCGRNRLPEIHAPVGVDAFLASFSKFRGLRLIASLQPPVRPLKSVLSETSPLPADLAYVVGPEGDFTPSEIGRFRAADFLPVSLGPQVLRVETAALFLSSIMRYEADSAP